MKKTGTVFTGEPEKVSKDDYPSNRSVEPSAEQLDKQTEMQSAAVTQLENLSQDENPVLYSLSTVFPFELFPTIITIEKTKVNFKKTLFLGAADIRSIMISSIATVESESNLFFGTLSFIQKMVPEPPMLVHYLKREEAMKARRIIQGLLVTLSSNVDVTKVAAEDLVEDVERLGDSKATS